MILTRNDIKASNVVQGPPLRILNIFVTGHFLATTFSPRGIKNGTPRCATAEASATPFLTVLTAARTSNRRSSVVGVPCIVPPVTGDWPHGSSFVNREISLDFRCSMSSSVQNAPIDMNHVDSWGMFRNCRHKDSARWTGTLTVRVEHARRRDSTGHHLATPLEVLPGS